MKMLRVCLDRAKSMARRSKARVSGGRRRRRSPHRPAERTFEHFVKIILPTTLQDKKLRIPKKFSKMFRDELSDVAEVVGPNGRAWRVRLTKAQNQIWFDGGWEAFMKHHSIDEGYLFVFRYTGSTNFSVLIFDKTGCEIQSSTTGTTSGDDITSGKNSSFCDDDDDGVEILDSKISFSRNGALKTGVSDEGESKGESSKRHEPLSKKNGAMRSHNRQAGSQEIPSFGGTSSKKSDKHVNEEHWELTDSDNDFNESSKGVLKKQGASNSQAALFNKTKKKGPLSEADELLQKTEDYMETIASGFAKASQKSKMAIHAARMFKPEGPSFMVLLRPYNFNGSHVYVPDGFASNYLSGASMYARLEVSDGRQWPLHIVRTQQGHTYLRKGWREFSAENNLQDGDVCVFELINSKKFALKVSIFHAVED